jgi:D-lyxose ketol-isomerase
MTNEHYWNIQVKFCGAHCISKCRKVICLSPGQNTTMGLDALNYQAFQTEVDPVVVCEHAIES